MESFNSNDVSVFTLQNRWILTGYGPSHGSTVVVECVEHVVAQPGIVSRRVCGVSETLKCVSSWI